MITPPVGWRVQFWPGGEKSPNVKPICADVVESGMNGQVRLNLSLPGGGEQRAVAQYVKHIDDTWVKDHLPQLRHSRGGVMQGAWDWVPGLEMKQQAQPKQKPKTTAA